MRRWLPRQRLSEPDRRALLQLVAGALLILSLIAGPSLFGMLTISKRLDGSLAGATEPVNVVVTMEFEPRDFHLRTLQRFGVFGGKVSETKVRIFQVTPEGLEGLSQLYWVTSIERPSGP
jgi:hypothetical protein